MSEFLWSVSFTTLSQLIGILGIFFILGWILNFLQKKTQMWYRQALGWRGILLTAWIGTPIHELSHAIMAKIFRHKLEHVSLFSPNEQTGSLGFINHSYKKTSLYQQIGNFFIGSAPMIAGALLIFALVRFLLPNETPLFESTFNSLLTIIQTQDWQSWRVWMFVYLSVCVVAHISPSAEDRKTMWQGLVWIVILLFLINSLLKFLLLDPSAIIHKTNAILISGSIIFSYAIFISLAHYLIAVIVFFPLSAIRRRFF